MNELKECRDEITRLKEIIAVLETQKEVRAARAEFVAVGEEQSIHLLVTYPSSVDEYSFGMFVAQQMANLLSAVGVKAIDVGEPAITPNHGGQHDGADV